MSSCSRCSQSTSVLVCFCGFCICCCQFNYRLIDRCQTSNDWCVTVMSVSTVFVRVDQGFYPMYEVVVPLIKYTNSWYGCQLYLIDENWGACDLWYVWLGGVAVGRWIRDREIASSIPSWSAARCNSGQVVHTHVPLFTKQYKLVLASAGGKVHHRSCVGHAGSHYRWTSRLAANRRHSSIVLTCGCRCTAALKWLVTYAAI